MAYEVFGSRKKIDWTANITSAGITATLALDWDHSRKVRGLTDHEHLDRTGFIHMNGRVFDPVLGRFLSPDPIVQFPADSQSWNRYSYLRNSPLSATDPTGFTETDEIIVTGERTDERDRIRLGSGGVGLRFWSGAILGTAPGDGGRGSLEDDQTVEEVVTTAKRLRDAEYGGWGSRDILIGTRNGWVFYGLFGADGSVTSYAERVSAATDSAGLATTAAGLLVGTRNMAASAARNLAAFRFTTMHKAGASISEMLSYRNAYNSAFSRSEMLSGVWKGLKSASRGLFAVSVGVNFWQGTHAGIAGDWGGVAGAAGGLVFGAGAALGGWVGFAGGLAYLGTGLRVNVSGVHAMTVTPLVDAACRLTGEC